MLSRYADVNMVMTIGLEKAIRDSSDSDPKYLLSDGVRGIGFGVRDGGSGQCRGMQGLMGDTIASIRYFSGTTGQSSILPEEYVLTIIHHNAGDHATSVLTVV